MSKQLSRDEGFGPKKSKHNLFMMSEPGLTTVDPVKAFKQRIKLYVKSNTNGMIDFSKQIERTGPFPESN